MLLDDTIAAIATPLGEGAVGIIRLSGRSAFEVAARLCRLPDEPRSHHAYLRVLRDLEGERLDEALVLCFKGPNSFTGEDVVELQCHGGAMNLQRVLDAALDAGARPAEAGEYSRRALMNGKLDLLQVESIADIIHARSEASHKLAQEHLAGRLSRAIDGLKEPLAQLLMLTEAAIDFSLEQDVFTIESDELISKLDPILEGVDSLLNTYDAGRMRHDGVGVAILGLPNAGKSSLLNHLLGEERALVTDIAGTTRDYLEESLTIGGVHFRLIDTAGIRETDDVVEAMGVERALRKAEEADITLVVVDASDAEPGFGLVRETCEARDERGSAQPIALLLNKIDKVVGERPAPSLPEGALSRTHSLSLSTGEGCEQLEDLLLHVARDAGLRLDEDNVLINRARHRDLLTQARQSLQRARDASLGGFEHEFIAMDLRECLDALGAMTGAITSDEILGRIFCEFCIGK